MKYVLEHSICSRKQKTESIFKFKKYLLKHMLFVLLKPIRNVVFHLPYGFYGLLFLFEQMELDYYSENKQVVEQQFKLIYDCL